MEILVYDTSEICVSGHCSSRLAGLPAKRCNSNASLLVPCFDPTQAIIPGATVKITNDATQATQTAHFQSDAGTFQFNELPPARFTGSVTAKGFQQNTTSNVRSPAETPRQP